jgi:hypothetical protein
MKSILVVFMMMICIHFVKNDLNIEDNKEADDYKDNLEYGAFDEERQVGDVIELGEGKNAETYLFGPNFRIKEPFFLYFVNQSCKDCKLKANEVFQLS